MRSHGQSIQMWRREGSRARRQHGPSRGYDDTDGLFTFYLLRELNYNAIG
jgi:hypothetical protein